MTTTRRALLTRLGGAALGLSVAGLQARAEAGPGGQARRARRGTLIGPGFYVDDATRARSYVLALVDLDGAPLERREIALDFFGHGLSPNPARPREACVFEKRGPGACVVDLVARKVLRRLETSPGHRFYGHGAWLADGSRVLVVESAIDRGFEGLVSIRDGKTFAVLGEMPTYGVAPHDCVLVDGGRTLAVTNGGGDLGGAAPCVTWVDVESRKLVEKLELPTPRLNTGHLAITRKRELAVVSAPRDGLGPDPSKERGGVSLRPAGRPLVTMESPAELTARMVGETLSVAVHEPTSTVAATNPEGNLVTFWDLRQAKLRGQLELEKPRGVTLTLDGRHFVVSYSKTSELVLVDPRTLTKVEGTTFGPTYMSGSHVIAYALPA